MARWCIFCGGRAHTKEHVFGRQLSEALIAPGSRLSHSVTRKAIGAPDQYHRRPAVELDVQVKQVCGRCNSTWMARLDNAADPWLTLMMFGFPAVLTPEAKRIIAAWAAKTAFMLLCAMSPPRIVHEDYRRWLYVNRQAPPRIGIWLAGYGGTVTAQYEAKPGEVAHLIPLAPKPLVRKTEMYLVSFNIGHLVVQVWTWADPSQKVAPILFPREFQEFVLKIWPPDHVEQAWPPPAVFDDIGLGKFFRMSDHAIWRTIPQP